MSAEEELVGCELGRGGPRLSQVRVPFSLFVLTAVVMMFGGTEGSESSRGSINFGALDEAWYRLGDRPVVGIGVEEEPSMSEVTSLSEEREGDQNVKGDPDAEVGDTEAEVDAREDVEDPDSS